MNFSFEEKTSLYEILAQIEPETGWNEYQLDVIQRFVESNEIIVNSYIPRRYGKTFVTIALTIALISVRKNVDVVVNLNGAINVYFEFAQWARRRNELKLMQNVELHKLKNQKTHSSVHFTCELGVACMTRKDLLIFDEFVHSNFRKVTNAFDLFLFQPHSRCLMLATKEEGQVQKDWDQFLDLSDKMLLEAKRNASKAATCIGLVIVRYTHRNLGNLFGQKVFNTWRQECWLLGDGRGRVGKL